MPSSRHPWTGHYLPPRVVTNFDVMKNDGDLENVHRPADRSAPPPARRADVSTSDLAPWLPRGRGRRRPHLDQIDLVIMNTITPDHADPGTAFLSPGQARTLRHPQCSYQAAVCGLIYGLSLADLCPSRHYPPRARGLRRGPLDAIGRFLRRSQTSPSS